MKPKPNHPWRSISKRLEIEKQRERERKTAKVKKQSKDSSK